MSGAQFTGRTASPIASHARTRRAVARSRLRTSRGNAASSNGLSLRTRLLLLQIAVTAVFLLIMGIVSTALFAQHLGSQFRATILAESTRSPADINQGAGPWSLCRGGHVQPVRRSGAELAWLGYELSDACPRRGGPPNGPDRGGQARQDRALVSG
jgi:hypothetical protein